MAQQSKNGMSLGGVLLVMFIVLKLTDNVKWSWIWVLSPLWLAVAFVLLIYTCVGIGSIVETFRMKRKFKKTKI